MTSVSLVPTSPEVKIASMEPWRSYQGREASGEQPGDADSRRSYARITQAFPLSALVCLNLGSCSIIILFFFQGTDFRNPASFPSAFNADIAHSVL